MSGRNLITVSAAIALSIVGAMSAAQAGDQGEDRGGFVVPGGVVGVNPAYHPGWFGKADNARNAYGYAAFPIHKRRPVHERTRSR
jgi:hypothetical protein